MKKFLLLATCMTMAAHAAFAADPVKAVPQNTNNPLATRNENAPPPVLRYLMDSGVKLTYLGDDGGVKGFLGENSLGKMQSFYVTPDGDHVIVGVLFKTGGLDVTGMQLHEMENLFKEAKHQLSKDGSTPMDANMNSSNTQLIAGTSQSSSPSIEQTVAKQIVASQPETKYLSHHDKSDFLDHVKNVPWFSVGAPNTPTLYMIVDPQCPYCHAAWAKLRPLVMNKKLSVNVIMIAGLSGSEEKAISILSRPEPGKIWLAGEGSVGGVSIAPAPSQGTKEYQNGKSFLAANDKFAFDYIKLKGTPYLAYIGQDGKLYDVEGPQNLEEFLQAGDLLGDKK